MIINPACHCLAFSKLRLKQRSHWNVFSHRVIHMESTIRWDFNQINENTDSTIPPHSASVIGLGCRAIVRAAQPDPQNARHSSEMPECPRLHPAA